MTPEQAEALLGRIDRLTTEVHNAEQRGQATHRLTQRLRIALYAVVALVVVLGGLAWQQYSLSTDLHSTQVTGCESGNRRVEGQRAWMQNYFDVSMAGAQAQGQADGPIGDYYRELEAWTLDETLPYRDCDHLDKPIPVPGPPPSFQEALKEALKQDKN